MSVIYDLDEVTYHADRSTLSSTGAKTLLRSPALYRYQLDHPKRSDAFDFGHLVHALVLGQPHTFTRQDWDGRTTAGKARAAEVVAKGLTPISANDWDRAHGSADAVAAHAKASEMFSGGRPEVSIYGDDPATGVKMRGRIDYLRDDGLLVDLKTTRNAEPGALARDMASMRYEMQAAWYLMLCELNFVSDAGFAWVAVEKEPPYLVSVVEVGPDEIKLGMRHGEEAREIYRDCTAADLWPDWNMDPTEIVRVTYPRWAFNAS